jgi:hypothetical protein
LERKIAIATRGLDNHFIIHLRRLQRRQNIETICNYIIAMNTEINPVLAHKKDQLQVLCYYLSEYYCNQNQNQNQNQNNKNNQNKNKSFYEMTRDDILGYLDNGRKTEESDPYHKWTDAYNLHRLYLMGFFKWLYHQDIFDSKIRQNPDIVKIYPN